MSTTKAVYLTVSGRDEQVEFSSEDTSEDILETFRSIAEAGPNDILKLHNQKGFFLQISSNIPVNTPDDRYQLEVVAKVWRDRIPDEVLEQWENIERRLATLENLVIYQTTMPKCFEELLTKVNNVKNKVEGIAYLSWLGLYKDLPNSKTIAPLWDKYKMKDEKLKQQQYVIDKYRRISSLPLDVLESQFSLNIRNYLKQSSFDNWQWEEAEMLLLLETMFQELNFISTFNIQCSTLQEWLCDIYLHYFNVPFHNFKHCFMVTQMMYSLIWQLELRNILSEEDQLTLLISAICHDLEHSGFSNVYHVNAQTMLARTYNDRSPLENHHCDVAFRILEKWGLLKSLSKEQYLEVRQGIIRCILSTDMAKHLNILQDFEAVLNDFNPEKKEHRLQLMSILIKVADISNELRPLEVAEPWLECLLNEFFAQSDAEKLEGLPVTAFMDRETVVRSKSQVHFIKNVLLPLLQALARCFPKAVSLLISPAHEALSYYERQSQEYENDQRNKEAAQKIS